MSSGKTKKYTVHCNDCGKYPKYELGKKQALQVAEEHKKIFDNVYHEIHNPKIVEVSSR